MSLAVGRETMNGGAEIHSDVNPPPKRDAVKLVQSRPSLAGHDLGGDCSLANATLPTPARSGQRPGWGRLPSLPHLRNDACQCRGPRTTYGKSTTSWMSKLAVCSTSSRTMLTNPSLGVQLTSFMRA